MAATAVDHDSDLDSWVNIDSDNPADSSDDDAGVRSLSSGSGLTTPDCASDDDHPGAVILALSASSPTRPLIRRGARSPSPDNPADVDAEDLIDLAELEVVTQPPPPGPKLLSGLFHHMLEGRVNYAAFDPILCWPEKVLVPDPTFSACDEAVTALASTAGLVCLRADASKTYIVANPATYQRVRLPRHSCDHLAYGDPAVVITFEKAAYTCCPDHRGHYHVVVAFPLGDGVYAYESFSSRTWRWTVGAGVDAVEHVISASGVGALGRAFWRTTLGYFLCFNPATRTADLIPAPQEVLQWPYWELGEMDDTLCVTCMDERVNGVALTKLHLQTNQDDGTETFNWSFLTLFEGGCLRNRDRVELLRSQGPEVVMWDPNLELVVAMDTEGRTTRTIGPLSGLQYYSDFIPYVSSSTGITRTEAGAECMLTAAEADAEAEADVDAVA